MGKAKEQTCQTTFGQQGEKDPSPNKTKQKNSPQNFHQSPSNPEPEYRSPT